MYSIIDYTVARQIFCILVTVQEVVMNTFTMFCLYGIKVTAYGGGLLLLVPPSPTHKSDCPQSLHSQRTRSKLELSTTRSMQVFLYITFKPYLALAFFFCEFV